MERKLFAIDNILKEEEKEREEEFQKFLTIGGFLLTLLFGLPTLYETIVIVRKLFTIWSYNIPFLTLENVSFGSWIILNILIYVRMQGKKLIKKF